MLMPRRSLMNKLDQIDAAKSFSKKFARKIKST
jgi:hypothetical protein